MIYEYLCHNCNDKFDLFRTVAMRDDPAECPQCHSVGTRMMISSRLPEGVVVNNSLTTDFGDGSGEQTYTRAQYIDKCTQLEREPVGLLWRNQHKTEKG